jgi:hypothetical protein
MSLARVLLLDDGSTFAKFDDASSCLLSNDAASFVVVAPNGEQRTHLTQFATRAHRHRVALLLRFRNMCRNDVVVPSAFVTDSILDAAAAADDATASAATNADGVGTDGALGALFARVFESEQAHTHTYWPATAAAVRAHSHTKRCTDLDDTVVDDADDTDDIDDSVDEDCDETTSSSSSSSLTLYSLCGTASGMWCDIALLSFI